MIYLDNAASAPVSKAALAAAMPFLTENFANPSSLHTPGREAALAVAGARGQCAAALGASPEEIVFTSGGTESGNLAVFSAIGAKRGRRIVVSQIEHPAVLEACREAERRGFETVTVAPDAEGIISAKDVAAAITPDTALVSVMAANNETGALQPIREIGAVCRQRGVLFHTDAVQAVGSIPIDLRELPVDMLSASAHKIGGLKGCGLLFVRKNAPVFPAIFGGGQERGLRSGTENVAGIAALGAAISEACADIPEKQRKISALRDLLIRRMEAIPNSRLNGSAAARLCGNVSFSFLGIDGEALVLNLDLMGVCASTASACSAGKQTRSHVLRAMGVPEEWLGGTLRLTLSGNNTEEEIETAAGIVKECVERLRSHG